MSGPPDNKPVSAASPTGVDLSKGPISMLPDGTILQFQPGTSSDVIDAAFKRHLAAYQAEQATNQQASVHANREIGAGEAAAIGGTQGLTFNFGDEGAAAIAATVGMPDGTKVPGATWRERYDNALTIARAGQHAAQTQHPVAYGAGEVTGAAVPALVAPELYGSSAIASAPTMASAVGRSALASGIYGGVTGFGAGEGGPKERLQQAATGAVTSAAVGAAAVPMSRAAGYMIQGRQPNPTIPSNDVLHAAGNAAYDAADNAGVIITPQTMQGLLGDVQNDLRTFGFHPANESRIVAPLESIQRQVASGQPITLRGLDVLRQIAARAGDSPDRGTRSLSSQIVNRIDNLIENLSPQQLVQGDEATAVPALQQARQIWSSLRKSELVDELVNAADLQAASTNSGGNLQNTIRQKLRTILTNRNLGRGFTAEERDALEQIVRGTPTQNTLRILGRLAPSSNSWLGVLSTLAGGPAGALVPVIGAAAKGAANRSTQNAVAGLSDLVRSGANLQMPPGTTAPVMSPMAARLLAGLNAGGSQMGQAYANALMQPRGPGQ